MNLKRKQLVYVGIAVALVAFILVMLRRERRGTLHAGMERT